MVTGIAFYLPPPDHSLSCLTVIEFHKLDSITLLFCIAASPLLKIVFAKERA